MKKLICHITDRTKGDHLGIDEEIAKKMGWTPQHGARGYNPHKVSAFRALYDQNALEHEQAPLIADDVINPTMEQIEEAYKKLENFIEATRRVNAIKVIDSTKNVPAAYNVLRHAFSIAERNQNIASISEMFSQEVDRLLTEQNNGFWGENKKVPRQAVIEGFQQYKGSSLWIGGAPAILEAVYNRLLQQRQMYYAYSKNPGIVWNNLQKRIEAAKLPDAKKPSDRYILDFSGAPTNAAEVESWSKSRYEAYTKVLQNWHALLPFVMRNLVKTEGVKLNLKADCISAASTDNYDGNSLAAQWDMAESVREGWQKNNDKESAYAEIGQQVRRFLSTIYEVESIPEFEIKGGKRIYKGIKTRPVYNALQRHIYKDPVQVHQYLSEYFRGIQSQKDLMDRLIVPGTDRAKIPWMQPLVNIVTSNPQLATLLFVEFKKNFQPYSMMYDNEKKRDGSLKKIATKTLNKVKNLLKDKYEISFSNRGHHPVNVKIWGFTPIFEEGAKGGKVNWERLSELREYALKWVYEKPVEKTGLLQYSSNVYNAPAPSWLTDKRKNTFININGKEERLTYDKKRDFLLEVFTSLGFDVTVDAIDSILNSNDIYRVREVLEQLFNPRPKSTYTGFTDAIAQVRKGFLKLSDPNITESEKKEALERLNKRFPDYKRLYDAQSRIASNGEKVRPVKECCEKLMDIITKHQDGKKVESRARYQDNTLFSFVKPSYLGDRLETIENFVQKDDHEGLLQFLQDEYLQSPFFVDDKYIETGGKEGKILNLWLSDLVNACKSNRRLADTVANIFNFERDLGNEIKKFEDFTIKEHGVDMLVHFFADEQTNKGYDSRSTKDARRKMSALYPVFVLGDSGVSKYIRAPRISSAIELDVHGKEVTDDKTAVDKVVYRFDENAKNKVIDSFWNLYQQEKRRMALDEAMTYKMYANGKEVKHPKGEFSFLTFLNPSSQEYIDDYHIPENLASDEQTVKEVIRKYLENSTLNNVKRADGTVIPSFKQRLQDMGLLELGKNGKGKDGYKFLNSVMTPANINEKLTEFYWNTMLATAMQMQLLTIDPCFYASTKELQKRYKENHAPGNCLDTYAVDRKGNYYSEDGMESVVYFKDLKLNAETYNPEFMEAVLRTFAKPGVDVDAAIADGILKPAVTESEKIVKHNKLIDLLGNETVTQIYEPYMNNSLTDGQGYRTLKSYRKVMGMYGKWSDDMERAYDYIMDIREKCKNEKRDVTSEELKYIADFALVLQPINPFMFTHEQIDVNIQKVDSKTKQKMVDANGQPIYAKTKRYIPVQHKYAEALIIPELLPKGSKLRDLGLWMDEKEVDLVGSDKICKVGCFGQCDLSGVTDSNSLFSALGTARVHKLEYKDYRVQTNVPEHINVSRLFGTQIRKLIMAGLKADNDYSGYLGIEGINLSTGDGKNTNCKLYGQNLLALYNSLICANIMDSYDNFEKNAKDIQTLAEMLQQSTIGNTRESLDNLFSYLVTGNEEEFMKFAVPLFEGGLEHDSAALLLSTFRKIVNKQQINGGSAVQVSAFGINGYSESGDLRFVQDPSNKANILYAEVEMPFDKSIKYTVTDSRGNTTTSTVNLDYDTYCFMDGHLKPSGEALEKDSKDYKKYLSYTYKKGENGELVPCSHTDPNARVYKPLIEAQYPGILNIIAYRIPTESTYSMLNCQIKRFSSKMAGGTLKVPAQGTTIAGFDFDIDKLYFMQREYHKKVANSYYEESNYSEGDKWKVWNAIYKENDGLFTMLQSARYKEQGGEFSFKYTEDQKKWGTLNSYFNKINGSQYVQGKSKGQLFREYAQKLGIEPVKKNDSSNGIEEHLDTYDFTKAPEDKANSRTARNNLLIDIMQARLMDAETMKQRYTPGGFEEAKKTARFLRELQYGSLEGVVKGEDVNIEALKNRQEEDTDPEPNYSVLDPYTIMIYNQQNQLAAKLIGIFANQNTHTAFVSCMNKFALKKPIDFCGHTGMKDLLHKDSPKAAEASLRVAQFLAASVDAVKDPVLNFMNLNTLTADSAALLARLGYSMDEIGLFLSQPIIVDICQETFNSGRNIRSVISDMQDKLKKNIIGDPKAMRNPTANDLALGIINSRKSKERGEEHDKFLKDNAKMQYAVLSLFNDMQKAAQDVSDFVASTKFTASNSVGSTFGALYAQQLKVNSYLDKFKEDNGVAGRISYAMEISNTAADTGLMSTPLENSESMLSMSKQEYLKHVRFNPFAYEQAMYDTNRKAVRALSKYYPYETELYKNARDAANTIGRYGNLSEDDINAIHRDIPVYLLAKQTFSDFYGEGLHRVRNAEGKYVKSNITNREYYREQFAGELVSMLGENPELAELEIFKYILPSRKSVVYGQERYFDAEGHPLTRDLIKDVWNITIQDVGGLDAETKEAIKESWESLMDKENVDGEFKNPKYAELGKDLFMYCFYQLGYQFSPYSFMHLAPTAVKENLRFDLADSQPISTFKEGEINLEGKGSNDVLVWSANSPGMIEKIKGDYDIQYWNVGELQKNTFRMGDELNHKQALWLVNTAIAHPELRFKIDRTLTQEEFDLFSSESLGKNVPSNIYFSQETLNNVDITNVAKDYGKTISYCQYLNRILQGEEKNFDVNDFMKQWILNHPDNARFVFDINRANKTLSEKLKVQAQESLKANQQRQLTFDVSSLIDKDNSKNDTPSSLDNLVKLKITPEGKVANASWAPCIVYNNSYYIAENGDNSRLFNENSSLCMTYVKVTPLGSTKSLKYDGNKTLKPSMRYQSYFGEEGEDLSHAEYIREITPTQANLEEQREEAEKEGAESTVTLTPEANGSEVSLDGRDSSDISNAIDSLKKFAEDNSIGVDAGLWEEALNKLLDMDLRNQVLNEEDSLNDNTYDSVEDAMVEILGRRNWRKMDESLKESLVQTVFEYNKNPKYLETESQVNSEEPAGGNTPIALGGVVRSYMESSIIQALVAGLNIWKETYGKTDEDIKEIIDKKKEDLHAGSDKDILDTIAAIQKACKEKGILVLDADGNLTYGC